MIDFQHKIWRSLEASSKIESVCVFPTIHVDWPLKSQPGITSADSAMAYLSKLGFKSDRTRMNLYGYPGLFRKLNEPPPWIEVTQEDVEGDLTPARQEELQPLYLYAAQKSVNHLLSQFLKYRADMQNILKATGNVTPLFPDAEGLLVDEFKENIKLVQCLGENNFQSLYEAVFEYDNLTAASGAPDLFVWDTNTGIWFFAEVKGPHDYVRKSQLDWVNANWDRIKGRFVLLVGVPNA